jgi:hypothetical protein
MMLIHTIISIGAEQRLFVYAPHVPRLTLIRATRLKYSFLGGGAVPCQINHRLGPRNKQNAKNSLETVV